MYEVRTQMTSKAGTMKAQMRPDSIDNQHLHKHTQNKCTQLQFIQKILMRHVVSNILRTAKIIKGDIAHHHIAYVLLSNITFYYFLNEKS